VLKLAAVTGKPMPSHHIEGVWYVEGNSVHIKSMLPLKNV